MPERTRPIRKEICLNETEIAEILTLQSGPFLDFWTAAFGTLPADEIHSLTNKKESTLKIVIHQSNQQQSG